MDSSQSRRTQSTYQRRRNWLAKPRLLNLESRITPAAAMTDQREWMAQILTGPMNRPALKDADLWDSGEAYEIAGGMMQLVRRMDEVVVRVDNADWQPQGGLAGFTVLRTLNPTTLVLQAPASVHFVPDDGFLAGLSNTRGVEWTAPVYTEPAIADGWRVATNEIVVRLDAGVAAAQFFASAAQVESYRPLWGTPDQFVASIADGGVATFAASVELANLPGAVWAEPNFVQGWREMYTPNDPLYPNQWHLENSGASGGKVDADVDASSAWDVTTGNTNVVVAVIDDSVQIAHPDLAPNIFINPGEIAGNSIDDDNNGWIDDVNGYDFVNYDNDPSPGVADDNHGTNVAGVIAAKGDNTLGVAGVAYNVRILPVRIGLGGTFTSDADIAAGVYYASGRTKDGLGTWNAAQITNNSWGGGGLSQALIDSFTWSSNSARGGKGVLNFIAAGNGGVGSISSPAILAGTLSGVMAIGASTNSDVRSGYSQYGPQLDLVSPSNGGSLGIQTTDRTGADGYTGTDYNSGFGGTSSATPLAAGIGALVLSQDLSMTAAQIRGLLKNTTDMIGALDYDATGRNDQYGNGRINANMAVRGVGVVEIQALVNATNIPDGGALNYTTFLNTPQDYVVRVRNQGTLDLNLGSINLAPGLFSILSGFGDSSLSVGESTAMTVRFNPTTPGNFSETLTFTSNDADEATFDITLNGSGIAKSISGTVFEDFDADNVRDAGEPGLAGRQVYLDGNNNGLLDTVTTTLNSTDVPKTLPDVTTTNSTLSVSGLLSLADVNVKISLTHTYDGDLTGYLIGPTGIKVTLFAKVGSSFNDFTNTIFDDQAATPITSGSAPFTGTFQPAGFLSAFDGSDPNGTWTLQIVDSASGDSGTLTSWSLTLATGAAGEVPITTAADGSYYFAGLAPDTYHIRASAVTDWTTAPPQMVTINSVTDQFAGRDFGSSRANTIYGQSYIERDGNGVPGPGESGLPNRVVFIDTNGDTSLNLSTAAPVATDVPKAINDFSTASSTLAVTGTGQITDVNVKLSLTHTYDADLSGYLVSPAGTKILLFSNVGGAGQNFTDTVFDDEAATSITAGSAPFTGSFRPEALLSGFVNEFADGTWTLQIVDPYSQDTGSLTAWSMEIAYAAEPYRVTDANGWYSFANQMPGTSTIRIAPEPGFAFRPAGGVHTVTLNAGDTIVHRDFGRYVEGGTYGRLFNDVNNNGIDDGEGGLAGWTVYSDLDNSGDFQGSLVTNYPSANVPVSVPDVTTVTSTISIAGPLASIQDINVKLNIAHTYDLDLTVTLISPTGTRVELTSGNGSNGDGYVDTIFDDAAAGSVTAGTAPFTATYKPEQALSILNGTDINGVWTLEVADKLTGDSGTLNSWSLAISTGEPTATTDANGYYQFTNLPAGIVNLRRIMQPGYVPTSPVGGVQSFTHVTGVADFDKSFGQRLAPAPTVTGVTFGDGTSQRSMVKQMVVTFSESVTFAGNVADAFTLFRTGTGTPTGPVILTASPLTGSANAVTITFSGALTTNDSLNDGFYNFTIDSDLVTGIGGKLDGGSGAGSDYTIIGNTVNKYFRLFGDADGSGVTDLGDFAAFRNAFNLGPNSIFDFGEGDNNVGLADFAQFRGRFNLTP